MDGGEAVTAVWLHCMVCLAYGLLLRVCGHGQGREVVMPLAMAIRPTRQTQREPPLGVGDFARCALEPFRSVVRQLGNVSRLHEPRGFPRASFAHPWFPASGAVAYAVVSNGGQQRINQPPALLGPGSFNLRCKGSHGLPTQASEGPSGMLSNSPELQKTSSRL